MERRKERRIKRRLTCEFYHGASSHRGIILDLGPSGAFIRTNAVLSPGTEIDIHLAASAAAPAMTLRGCVVRRKSVPATLTTLIQPGLGVRILEAPREFGLLTSDCVLDEAIQTDSDFGRAPGADQQQKVSPPPTGSDSATGRTNSDSTAERTSSDSTAERTSSDSTAGRTGSDSTAERREWDRSSQSPPDTNAAEVSGASRDTEKRRSKTERPSKKKEEKREPERSGRTEAPKPPRPLVAVLVGGSDLDEIAEILPDLGVEIIQCGPYDPQLAALDDASLLVVSGEIAMSDPIPVDTDTLVGIAVCGAISETMRSQIRQQGFRYLLRPHTHPEALRLLLRYAIYAERDRRGRVRHPVGCEVSWRAGWKRNRGRLLDISHAGCCLLVEDSPQVGARIAIKIPAETAGGKALKLRGRVLRTTPNAAHSGNERTALGVILEDIAPAAQKILVDLCETWSESPPMLSRGERPRAVAPVVETHGKEALTSKPQTEVSQTRAEGPSETEAKDPTSTESQASCSDVAQRSTCRGVFEREVVQIDEEARVVQALLGRDLSLDGIRVVRQPGLVPGDKLRLALFDTSQQEPLILSAEVSRDDGGSGLFLHFVDLSEEMTARIEEIVARLPAIESIDPHGDAKVVPAGVVSGPA
jgi:hypothetical protein